MESNIYADFIKLQKDLPKLQKTAENPFFKSAYVPLDQVLDKVLPVLHKHDFALMQSVGYTENGDPTLNTSLMHTSGAKIESTMLLQSKSADPQAQGSAITYARRYQLVTLLGMSVGEDDDGNAATTAEAKAQETSRQQTSPKAIDEIRILLTDKGIVEPEDQKFLITKLSNGQPLNTSGITRVRKEIMLASPDTLQEILDYEAR